MKAYIVKLYVLDDNHIFTGIYYPKFDDRINNYNIPKNLIYSLTPLKYQGIKYIQNDYGDWVVDIDWLRQTAYKVLVDDYKNYCKENDNNFIKYLKRRQAAFFDNNDEMEFERTIDLYRDETVEYKTMKDLIYGMSIIELIDFLRSKHHIINEV